MADTVNVLAICGSLRKGSFNRMLMNSSIELAPEGVTVKEAPPWASLPIYNADDQEGKGFPAEATAIADAIRAADGVLIVSPEYNWSIPGGLKNAVDWLSRMKDQPFNRKPLAIQSAAAGLLGGGRGQVAWRQSMAFLEVNWMTRPEVLVTFAAQKFDEQGRLKDQTTADMIKAQLGAFRDFIRKHPKA